MPARTNLGRDGPGRKARPAFAKPLASATALAQNGAMMEPDRITRLFTGADGTYRFARWNRALAPVAFGVTDATLATLNAGISAVAGLGGLDLTETDPEQGANVMVFFCRDWDELAGVPDMAGLLPDLDALVPRLKAAAARSYRRFTHDPDGAIRSAIVVIRIDGTEADADALALDQAVRLMLVWGPGAFDEMAPLVRLPGDGRVVVAPDCAAVIRAAYDPVMPVAATDASHALRLAARVGVAS